MRCIVHFLFCFLNGTNVASQSSDKERVRKEEMGSVYEILPKFFFRVPPLLTTPNIRGTGCNIRVTGCNIRGSKYT